MLCKLCENKTESFFNTLVLKKYQVTYYKCSFCNFIQTQEPFWLEEAYSNIITKLDIGLISRNLYFADIVAEIIINNFGIREKFLDYGGGYGMFVRLMRDKGFDFYRQDIYCQNLFAEYFDISDLPKQQTFEVVTAFEVFEHLSDPVPELENMLSLSDNIIFSTELQPQNPTPETWWYFVPETGQHISLFSLKSLEELAKRFDLNFYTNNVGLHVFSKKPLKKKPFEPKKERLFGWIKRRKDKVQLESLLMKDFDYIRKKINAKEG